VGLRAEEGIGLLADREGASISRSTTPNRESRPLLFSFQKIWNIIIRCFAFRLHRNLEYSSETAARQKVGHYASRGRPTSAKMARRTRSRVGPGLVVFLCIHKSSCANVYTRSAKEMWSSSPTSFSIVTSEAAERDPRNGGGFGAEEALLPLQPLFDLPSPPPPHPNSTTSPPSWCSPWEEPCSTFLAWPTAGGATSAITSQEKHSSSPGEQAADPRDCADSPLPPPSVLVIFIFIYLF
jgi:hypothetical protein